MYLYSIYDKVAKRFNAPFVAENDDVANRSFQLGVKNNPYASDLDLFCLGGFCSDKVLGYMSGEENSDCCQNAIYSFDIPVFIAHYIGEVIDNG